MPLRPPVHELEFLKKTKNHRELSNNLGSIDIPAEKLLEYAEYICACWLDLAKQHLDEAEKALAASCTRTVFSRSYYAAYNASKAVRYFVRGQVSLKADDHKFASTDLPDDLLKVEDWANHITVLYEHRLRADYDNWSDTKTNETITPTEATELAKQFIAAVQGYLSDKFGMKI